MHKGSGLRVWGGRWSPFGIFSDPAPPRTQQRLAGEDALKWHRRGLWDPGLHEMEQTA